MNKNRLFTTLGLGLAVAAAAVAGIYWYQGERQAQAEKYQAVLQQGIAEFGRKEYEQSAETLRSIPPGAITDWKLHYYTGAALIKLRDFEAAVAQLEQALRINSSEEDVLFALGVAHYKLGHLGLSKGYFSAVLELNPQHAEAKGLMDIMADLERYQESIAEQGAEPDGG